MSIVHKHVKPMLTDCCKLHNNYQQSDSDIGVHTHKALEDYEFQVNGVK